MALTNQNGHYLKIEGCDNNQRIFIRIYKDEETRQNPGEFDNIIIDSEYSAELSLEFSKPPIRSTTLDDIKAKCYSALKMLPKYSNWEDC